MPDMGVYEAIASALSTLDVAICLFDPDDRTVLWNAAFLKFFPEHAGHVHAGEPYRDNLYRFYDSRLTEEERPNIERYVSDGIARHRVQTRPFAFIHRGRRLLVGAYPMPGGRRLRVWRAVNEETRCAKTSQAPEPFPIDLLEYIADGATVLDPSGRILAANSEFNVLYDIAPGQAVVGSTLPDVVRQAWTHAGLPASEAEVAVLDNMRFVGAPFEVELPGGRWRRVIARDNKDGVTYFTHSDITPLKRALAELSSLAVTDGLTGLLNRRRFDAMLDVECRRAVRGGTPLSLILIDVDHFKTVNDSLGHPVGDACLGRIARIIKAAIRFPGDIAARVGGDEFAVVLPDTESTGAWEVAKAIHAAVSAEPWEELDAGMPRVTVSIGLCGVTGAEGLTGAELVRQADTMLYQAKYSGRDRLVGHPSDVADAPLSR